MKIKEHIDKVGFLGSLFAALCCIGTPAILAFLVAVGAGFLINDYILLPLLVVSLIITIWGLTISYKTHRKSYCIILGIISAILIFSGIWISRFMVYLGLLGLVFSTVWNIYLKKHAKYV